MNNESLLLIEKHTDTLVQQTRTQPQQTLEFKMNNQMKTFSFDSPFILDDEGRWLLAVTFFATTKSVFNTIAYNNSFSIVTPSHWSTQNAEKTINKLNNLLGLRSENDLDLHINEVNQSGIFIILDGEENIS